MIALTQNLAAPPPAFTHPPTPPHPTPPHPTPPTATHPPYLREHVCLLAPGLGKPKVADLDDGRVGAAGRAGQRKAGQSQAGGAGGRLLAKARGGSLPACWPARCVPPNKFRALRLAPCQSTRPIAPRPAWLLAPLPTPVRLPVQQCVVELEVSVRHKVAVAVLDCAQELLQAGRGGGVGWVQPHRAG